MNRSKYSPEQIQAENEARIELAYDRIKSYITAQQNRFIGACDYSIKRIKAQCNPCYNANRYIGNVNSHVRNYLAIPSQTLADMAGFFLRTSRSESKRRIPYQMIIDRLEREGVVQVIEGSRKDKRANIYAIPVQSVYRLKERINQIQKPEQDKPAGKQEQVKPVKRTVQDGYRAQISRMSERDFYALCVHPDNAHYYDKVDKCIYAETYSRLKDYYWGEKETRLVDNLRKHGITV